MSRARVMGLASVGLLALLAAGAMGDWTRPIERRDQRDEDRWGEKRDAGSETGAPEGTLLDPASVGRTVELRVWRGNTTASSFSAYPCEGDGRIVWLNLRFAPGQQDLVRALPPTLLEGCPRVQVRLTAIDEVSGHLEGELIAMLDGEPKPATDPEGELVAYAAMDDINLAGNEARGKIAVLPVYRGTTEKGSFAAHPCDSHGGIQFLHVRFTREQQDTVRRLPKSADHCQRLRMVLSHRAPDAGPWHADLMHLERSTP